MAAKTSFKQQCPSCENMVTIRDESLIGQKIDCPKCKYRFVVEEPVDEEEDFEDESKPEKKSKPAKGKKRARDDDEDRPRKKESGSKKLVLGLAIGGAALVLLAVAAVLIFMNMGSTDKKPSAGTPPGRAPGGSSAAAQNTQDDDTPKKEEGEEKKAAPAKITSETATNLLPNDTEAVVNLMPQEILGSPLGKTAFDTPSAFQRGQFQSAFGFSLDDLERVIVANNVSQNWSFTVVRTSKPVKQDVVQKALRLKKAENPPPGFDRSEEHTSELQSQFHLVCRLLLEKKKTAAGPNQEGSLTPSQQSQ